MHVTNSRFGTLAFGSFFGEELLTVRALPGWRACEEIEDSLPDGLHARLWRWSSDFFFPSRCFEAAGL